VFYKKITTNVKTIRNKIKSFNSLFNMAQSFTLDDIYKKYNLNIEKLRKWVNMESEGLNSQVHRMLKLSFTQMIELGKMPTEEEFEFILIYCLRKFVQIYKILEGLYDDEIEDNISLIEDLRDYTYTFSQSISGGLRTQVLMDLTDESIFSNNSIWCNQEKNDRINGEVYIYKISIDLLKIYIKYKNKVIKKKRNKKYMVN